MSITEKKAYEIADWIEHDLADEDITEIRPGPGRPPLPPGEAVEEVLTIRVTAEEKQRFKAVAEEHGRSPSEEGRLAVLRHLEDA